MLTCAYNEFCDIITVNKALIHIKFSDNDLSLTAFRNRRLSRDVTLDYREYYRDMYITSAPPRLRTVSKVFNYKRNFLQVRKVKKVSSISNPEHIGKSTT